jgi:protein-tyrosine phosphatase
MRARARNRELSSQQVRRLEAFDATECVDIHCHCLPCVDDGPDSQIQALALCRALVADGITTVVATPHQLGRYHGRNEGPEIRQAVSALQRSLMVEDIPLEILTGGDVRIDERIGRLLASGHVLTLEETSYLLLQLPSESFIDPLPLLVRLASQGIRPIIAHPERNRFVTSRPDVVQGWLDAGAALQLTSGSFAGDFGPIAERGAWFWLENGQAALVASDAHSTAGRPPRMTKAIRLIAARLGMLTARRVCIENPLRVIEDRALDERQSRSQVLGELDLSL